AAERSQRREATRWQYRPHLGRRADSPPGLALRRGMGHAGGMQTRVSDMLGVEFPILAFSHCRDVVAAVTNAGGFGVLGAVAHSPQRLRSELTWIEEQTGGKPYGVDLLLPPKYVGAEQGGIDAKQTAALLPEEHREFVDDLLT